jgi:predicted signal transduction protein with EAL and GGDEF domain
MSTGNIETWAGTISEIGPAYPFVGTEVILTIVCAIFVLWFLVKQAGMESAGLAEELREFGSKESLSKIVESEDPKNP